MNLYKRVIFLAVLLAAGWGFGPQVLASLEVLSGESGGDVDDKTEVNDSPAVLEGLRNLGSSIQVPGGTDIPGDSSGDPFGDGIGLLAMGDSALPPDDAAVPPPPPPDEVTFIPDGEGLAGTRITRNGKGQIIFEQTVDEDGRVTGLKEFYPDTGAEKTVQGPSAANMTITRHYDPPKEGEKRGVERITVASDSNGGTRVTRRDSAGKMTEVEKTSADGVKTVTRYDTGSGKPWESTTTYANGNAKETIGYQQDGSGTGTLRGEDGVPNGTVSITPDGTKTAAQTLPDGSVQTTVTNKDNEMQNRRTVNPDGSTTVEENPGRGQAPRTYTIPAGSPVPGQP